MEENNEEIEVSVVPEKKKGLLKKVGGFISDHAVDIAFGGLMAIAGGCLLSSTKKSNKAIENGQKMITEEHEQRMKLLEKANQPGTETRVNINL